MLTVRDYIKVKDKSFRITPFLFRHKFINNAIISCFSIYFYVIRLFKRKNFDNIKVLAIICFHRLGDTVFSIPAITEIFYHYSDYKIFIMTFEETKDILRLRFNDENIKTIRSTDLIFKGRLVTKRTHKILSEINPSIIFDLTGTPASAILIHNKQSAEKIGANLLYFKSVYTDFTPLRKSPRFIDNYLDVVRLAIPDIPTSSEYCFQIKIEPNKKIIIHPFAIRKAKEWKFNGFINLALRLRENFDVRVMSPGNFIPEDILRNLQNAGLNIKITNTLNDLIEEIKESSVFISNDSGPTYIANLLGKPTFTIYGPTNAKYSLPVGEFHEYFQKRISCSAVDKLYCFTFAGIDCPSNICMNNISADDVEISVRKFLGKLGIKEKV